MRGFQVLTVPENATHFLANSDGFQPEWAGQDAQVRMQRIFLDYQVHQEEAFRDFAALHPTKPAVLLLDCCTINSKVYTSDEQWEHVLDMPGKPKLTEEQLLNRYDLVIHMVTCALEGHYEWGPGSNNPGRYHNPDQAHEQDQRCLQVFGAHPQLRVVPHFPKFDDKIGKVVEFVNDALHVEGLAGRRKRRRCRVTSPDELAALAALPSTSCSLVTSTFLDEEMQHSVRRVATIPTDKWLEAFKRIGQAQEVDQSVAQEELGSIEALVTARSRKQHGAPAAEVLYERRTKVQAPNEPSQSYLTRRVTKEEDYYNAVESCTLSNAAAKLVLRFLQGSRYYELFFYVGHDDLVLDYSEEASPTSGSSEPPLPTFLELTGTRDLERQDSATRALMRASSAASPTKRRSSGIVPVSEDAAVREESAPKRMRFLRAHSTEEAALFGS